MRYLFLFWLGLVAATTAAAHEVSPAIADLTVTDGSAEFELAFSAEAVIAGVDLEGVQDTNATDQAAEVDSLRALPPASRDGARHGRGDEPARRR